MSHGSTKYPSAGVCIYCRRRGLRLSDEHVVPVFLGGQHILEGASCNDCARITSRFELDVARKLWGDARNSIDAPSRRKKFRKKYIVVRDVDGKKSPIKIPYSDYPAPFAFYKMPKCGFLEGLPEDVDISGGWQITMVTNEKVKNFEHKYDRKFIFKFHNVPRSFGRLIAKIGYGQVLTSINIDDFDDFCLPYILGKKENVSYVVGGSFDLPKPLTETDYSLSTVAFGNLQHILIIAEVRLLPVHETPLYHVVVGEIRGIENVQRVVRKAGMRMEIVPELPDAGDLVAQVDHWTPRHWPLRDR